MTDPNLESADDATDAPEPADVRVSTVVFGLAAATFFGGWLLAMTASPNLFDALTGYQFAEASGQDSMVEAARLNDAILPVIWVTAIAAVLAIVGGVLAFVQRRRPAVRNDFSRGIARTGWGAVAVLAGAAVLATGGAFAAASASLGSDASDLRETAAAAVESASAAYEAAKVVEDNAWSLFKSAEASNQSSGYGWCSVFDVDYYSCELSQARVEDAQNARQAAERETTRTGSELNSANLELERISPISDQLIGQATVAEPVRIGSLVAGGLIALSGLALLVFGIRTAITNRGSGALTLTLRKLPATSPIAPTTKRCPKCDEKVRLNASICKHCGSDLS